MSENVESTLSEILDRLGTIEDELNELHRHVTDSIEGVEAEIQQIGLLLDEEFPVQEEPDPEEEGT